MNFQDCVLLELFQFCSLPTLFFFDKNDVFTQRELIKKCEKLQKEKEMVYNPIQDANYFSFYVKDQQGEECKVIYAGTKPQDFEKSEQIVLIGKMKSDEFHASKILMKCPSKYNNDKVETKEFKAQTS